jgi:L-rhamnonate dehydratase
MKITEIATVRVNFPRRQSQTPPRRQSWSVEAEVANPMSRYPRVKRHRSLWLPQWESAWVKVTAEDGTWGIGPLNFAPVLAPVIRHLSTHLVTEEALATQKLADLMARLTKPYGTPGLASYAISALDLALWDLKGKLLGQPVYSLLGGAQKTPVFCYCTGNDVDWYQELGFRAFKLACPYGPADGLDGLSRNEEFVALARQQIGDGCELMLDCWMAFDVEYTVTLAERLRPYHLKWIEECLVPEDLDGHIQLRQRLPWQTLATGEHWYTHFPFQWAIQHKAVDILQPDIQWCGGMSTVQTIAAAAEASGLSVILHGGGNNVYGQHFTAACPASPWLECFIGSPPGVPLEESWGLPGQAIPQNGWLTPSNAPGFGLEIEPAWITSYPG